MYKDYRIIAVCISRIGDNRYFSFIEELNRQIVPKGYRLMVYQTCSDLYYNTENEKGEQAVFDLIDYSITDVVVIYDESIQKKDIKKKIQSKASLYNVPVISAGAYLEDGISLVFDYVAGFEKIVRHVVEEHGIKDVHFIAGMKNNIYSDERVAAYKRVLADNDMEFTEDMLSYGEFWYEPSRREVVKLIEEKRLPRAIICVNDDTAITACSVLLEYGYKVPEDVIVTGFDGIDATKYCKPSLTTAKCNMGDIVGRLVEIIGHIFSGKYENEYTIEYTPVISSSCGCRNDVYTYNAANLVNAQRDLFYSYQESEHYLYSLLFETIKSKTGRGFAQRMKEFCFEDTIILLNEECFDGSISPFEKSNRKSFSDNMVCLYDSLVGDGQLTLPYEIKREEICPHKDEVFETEKPLIMTALNCMGIPVGYTCFYFEVREERYSMILQYVNIINNTISGYRNIKYYEYAIKKIESMYKYDLLTGLLNRQSFYHELEGMISKTDKSCRIMLVSVDMDGLKNINDTYGHEEGDYAISILAKAVQNIPFENKVCARFGGDEMLACMVSDGTNDGEIIVKEAIGKYLSMANEESGRAYKICASIGVCSCMLKEFVFDEMYKKSDKLMYSDKALKPNRRK